MVQDLKMAIGNQDKTNRISLHYRSRKRFNRKTDLYGSLSEGKPNMGPAGIPVVRRSFGDPDGGFQAGGDRSFRYTGSKDRGTGDYQVTDTKAQQDYNRNRAIEILIEDK